MSSTQCRINLVVDPYLSYLHLLRTQQGNEIAVDKFASLRNRFRTTQRSSSSRCDCYPAVAGGRRWKVRKDAIADFGPAIPRPRATNSQAPRCRTEVAWIRNENATFPDFVLSAESGDYAAITSTEPCHDTARRCARAPRLAGIARIGTRGEREGITQRRGDLGDGPSVASISYSFDGIDWYPTSNLVRTMILGRGAIVDKRYGDETHRRVFARYRDQKGQESRIYPLRVEDDRPGRIKRKRHPRGCSSPTRIPTAPVSPESSRH